MLLTRTLLSQLLSILLVPAFTALFYFTVSFLRLFAAAHFAWLHDSPFVDGDYDSDGSPSEHVEEVDDIECVFCLCGIKEGEGIRELRCKHLFHRSCLDCWLDFGRATCPLCRDTLAPWRPGAKSAEADDGGLLGELELQWMHILSGGSF